jgi:DMSO/TMAO reductase YedYZ heme-binding membrane subunit
MLAVLLICLLPGATPAGGFGWDWLGALGFGVLAFLLALAFESESPAREPRLTAHRNLAVAACVLTGAHALGYLLLDPVSIEYLKPTAPGYMLAGLAGVVGLAVLTATAFPRPRRRVFAGFARFRRWHLTLAVGTLALGAWHAIGTGFSVRPGLPAVLLTLLLSVAPAAAWFARRWGRPTTLGPSVASGADGTRHIVLAVLLVVLLATLSAAARNP